MRNEHARRGLITCRQTSYHFGNLWGTTEIKATVGTGFVDDDSEEEDEEED